MGPVRGTGWGISFLFIVRNCDEKLEDPLQSGRHKEETDPVFGG